MMPAVPNRTGSPRPLPRRLRWPSAPRGASPGPDRPGNLGRPRPGIATERFRRPDRKHQPDADGDGGDPERRSEPECPGGGARYKGAEHEPKVTGESEEAHRRAGSVARRDV